MALGKRTRFEVFKRDSFACRYCGRTPPAIVLTIDHVLASSQGGPDDPVNLVAACEDCNSGKSDVPLCAVPPTTQRAMQRKQEVREQVEAFNAFLLEQRRAEDETIDAVARRWYEQFGGKAAGRWTFGEARRTSVRTFLRKLPSARVVEAVEIAASRVAATVKDDTKRWRYFCGVYWGMVRDAEGGTR